MPAIGVFCGSQDRVPALYYDAAAALGRLLAGHGIGIVYGGGNVGLMGALSDAALAGGGVVTGVIPSRLAEKEIAHHGITELHMVETMHQRKQKMMDLADAFVALPGGIGTMEEIFEVISWWNLGYHEKPCGFLNVGGYYDDLIRMLDRMLREGFCPKTCADRIVVETDAAVCLKKLGLPI